MSSLLKSLLIATLISSVAISPALAQRHGYRGGGGSVHVSGWNALALALIGTVLYLAAKAPPPECPRTGLSRAGRPAAPRDHDSSSYPAGARA